MISRLPVVDREFWALPLQAACLVAVGVLVGALVTVSPLLGAGLAALAVAFGLLTLEQRLVSLFLIAMTGGLAGYMFFGRGFAYAGVPPLFVSEMLLGLGALTLAYTMSLKRFDFLHILIIVFMGWGLLRTVPYIQTYGLDALRDGVVWGYAILALAISGLITRGLLERAVHGLATALPILLLWIPVLAVLSFTGAIPVWPQSGIALAIFEPGDMAVHLAAMAALVVSGLYYSHGSSNRLPAVLFWTLAIICFGFVAAVNRAGLLTIFAGIAASFLLWPTRQVFSFLGVATVIGVLILVINPNIQIGGVSREIGPEQIVRNVNSIVGSSENDGSAGLQDTKSWRQRWWDKIWGYTVNGPYFLTGKGFGINLANVDGFQTFSDGSSRSPHNGHFTILARMGVPGLAIWLTFQACFGFVLFRALQKAKATGALFWAQIDTIILIYWMAMLINMSFDVYLEGPQGGIWFWAIVGIGLGALRLQREAPEEPQDGVIERRGLRV